MSNKEIILQEIEKVPEELLIEIIDFIRFLQHKAARGNFDTALVSESSLKKDWLLPEEDEAWQDL